MYQQLPHLNLQIGDGLKLSYMSGLADTRSGLNMGNLEYHQLVLYWHPNLVLKFYIFEGSGWCGSIKYKRSKSRGGKWTGKRRGRHYRVNFLQTTFVVYGQPLKLSLTLGEVVACITIFSWPLLQKNKASMMNNTNSLMGILLGYQFNLEIMVTTCSIPIRPLFIHTLSFECTTKLCINFLNQFSVYFHI